MASAHGKTYWCLIGWWWGPAAWAGRVALWLVLWPAGLWRSFVHHGKNRDRRIERKANRG